MNDFWWNEGRESGHLQGWNDRRDFERRLLDAFIQRTDLSDGEKFLLEELRDEMLPPTEGLF